MKTPLTGSGACSSSRHWLLIAHTYRHWVYTFYLILRRGEGDKGAKTCDTLKCSEPSPPGGKSGKMFPHVGEQLSVQWDTVHSYWSIAFCSACIWLSLAERQQNIDSIRGCTTRSTWPIDAKLWKRLCLWIMFNIEISLYFHINDPKYFRYFEMFYKWYI